MPAEGGTQNGCRQPEADIDHAKAQIDEKPGDLCSGWNQSGGDQTHCGDQNSRGEHHDCRDKESGEKFSDDDVVPVQGLTHQPVQGSFGPLAVYGVKSHKDPDKRTHQCHQGIVGGDGIRTHGKQPQEQEACGGLASCRLGMES